MGAGAAPSAVGAFSDVVVGTRTNGTRGAGSGPVGNQPWVTILCRFGGKPATPHPPEWFDGLMGPEYPGLDHYWREVSYNQIDLAGSTVIGWYDLPKPKSSYVDADTPPPQGIDFDLLTRDCTDVADPDVFFPDFSGIQLFFNETLGLAAGGITSVSLDGQVKTYGVTHVGGPAPPECQCGNEGFDSQAIVVSEMQHALGVLWHSSGPYEQTYDSQWDVGSSPGGGGRGACPILDADYGCVGQHTIAWHKAVLGWIPGARTYLPTGGTTQITLHPLGGSMPADGYLWAKIPLGGKRFYTVEARRRLGYDEAIPGDAVVIHLVDTSRPDRKARVVDPDGDGDPNDEGAMWLPGESFRDSANGVEVSVDGEGPAGEFLVSITAPVVHERRVALRLRGHLIATGRVTASTAPKGAWTPG